MEAVVIEAPNPPVNPIYFENIKRSHIRVPLQLTLAENEHVTAQQLVDALVYKEAVVKLLELNPRGISFVTDEAVKEAERYFKQVSHRAVPSGARPPDPAVMLQLSTLTNSITRIENSLADITTLLTRLDLKQGVMSNQIREIKTALDQTKTAKHNQNHPLNPGDHIMYPPKQDGTYPDANLYTRLSTWGDLALILTSAAVEADARALLNFYDVPAPNSPSVTFNKFQSMLTEEEHHQPPPPQPPAPVVVVPPQPPAPAVVVPVAGVAAARGGGGARRNRQR